MKLSKAINKKPKAFDVDGGTFYVNRMTVKEVKKLHTDIKEIQASLDPELILLATDPTVVMTDEQQESLEASNGLLVSYLFKSVVVGDDGVRFDEIEDDTTYDDICNMLPIATLQKLPEAVMGAIAGNDSGN